MHELRIALLAMLLCLPACARSGNLLTPDEQKSGWMLLFDGHSTAGWHTFRKTAASNWDVVDGALKRSAEGGDLVSDGEFDNFMLELDWRLPAGGNSGVFFRAVESPKVTLPWTSIEVQLFDDRKTSPYDVHASAAAYDLYAPEANGQQKSGGWNHFRIVADGPHITHYFNGIKVCDYTIGSDDWHARVARSKFMNRPDFAAQSRGHIALQDHHAGVEFRNIKLLPLPAH